MQTSSHADAALAWSLQGLAVDAVVYSRGMASLLA